MKFAIFIALILCVSVTLNQELLQESPNKDNIDAVVKEVKAETPVEAKNETKEEVTPKVEEVKNESENTITETKEEKPVEEVKEEAKPTEEIKQEEKVEEQPKTEEVKEEEKPIETAKEEEKPVEKVEEQAKPEEKKTEEVKEETKPVVEEKTNDGKLDEINEDEDFISEDVSFFSFLGLLFSGSLLYIMFMIFNQSKKYDFLNHDLETDNGYELLEDNLMH